MTKANGVQIITPPSTLRDKVSKPEGRDNEPDFDAMDDIVQKLGREFVRRLPDELQAIANDLEALKQAPDSADKRNVLFSRVHDLKGQAGTFDYWMITVIGNDLCRFIEHAESVSPAHIQVMHYHVQAMTRVMDDKMIGKDPDGARNMVDTLHAMAGQVLQNS